jgi:Domain of unknown function (DUF1996)
MMPGLSRSRAAADIPAMRTFALSATRWASMLVLVLTVLVAPLPGSPPPAEAHALGSFAVQCGWTHTSMDDPIVYPGQPGMSHKHAFYGNKSTNAFSTRKTMMAAGTTCTDKKDLAAAWAPTASIKKGGEWRYVKPYRERTYYFPAIRDSIAPVTNIPKNLKIIGGNPHAMTRKENPHVFWYCGEGSPERPYPYDCRPYTLPKEDGFRAVINMPYCWDGVHTDSPDHMSHVVYANGKGICPDDHPKYIPQITVRIHFLQKDPCAGAKPCGPSSGGGHVRLRLSSGEYWTMHADFWNTWRQRRLNELTTKCLRHHKNCGIIGVETTDL